MANIQVKSSAAQTPHVTQPMRFEVKETKEGYLVKAALPGVQASDVEVSVTDNRVHISGSRSAEKEDEGENFYTYERSYGSFTRSFTMPEGIDPTKIQAELHDGILTVLMPKPKKG